MQPNHTTNSRSQSPAHRLPDRSPFVASAWRDILNAGTLIGDVDVYFRSGLVFRRVLIHRHEDRRWTELPTNTVEFSTVETRRQFDDAVLRAVDDLLDSPRGQAGGCR